MKHSVLCAVLLTACAARDPYAGQPQTAGNYQMTDDLMWAACQQQANEQLTLCNAMLQTNQNTNSGWQLRASYDRIVQTCPTHANDGLLGQYGACVTRVEAAELAFDPDAPGRREAAKARVDSTKADASFKQLLDAWMDALDGKNITCRSRDVSDSHRRECERWHAQMAEVEGRLEKFLVAKGYDKRDFRPLGLWPVDPDWRTSAN